MIAPEELERVKANIAPRREVRIGPAGCRRVSQSSSISMRLVAGRRELRGVARGALCNPKTPQDCRGGFPVLRERTERHLSFLSAIQAAAAVDVQVRNMGLGAQQSR